jgi:uncharacterized spore protein YtfJ
MANVAKTLMQLADRVRAGASARNVFADPVTVGDKTLIPAARIGYGFGAGGGKGGGAKSSGGGGAGMRARPVGVIEVTAAETRFIPLFDPARLGAALLVGVLVGLAIGRRSAGRAEPGAAALDRGQPLQIASQ